MSNENLLLLVNYSVAPLWLALLVAPRHRVTSQLVHSGWFIPILALPYAWLLFTDDPGPQGASFWTLAGVRAIFTTDRTVIACWMHYLVMDLFAGAWQARDAARRNIPHLLVAPCLFLTLMFGPIGLATWFVVRGVAKRRWSLEEAT